MNVGKGRDKKRDTRQVVRRTGGNNAGPMKVLVALALVVCGLLLTVGVAGGDKPDWAAFSAVKHWLALEAPEQVTLQAEVVAVSIVERLDAPSCHIVFNVNSCQFERFVDAGRCVDWRAGQRIEYRTRRNAAGHIMSPGLGEYMDCLTTTQDLQRSRMTGFKQ